MSLSNDRTQPMRGGRAVDISSADDVIDGATEPARVMYIGTGGDLIVDLYDGSTVTFANLPDAFILPIHVRRVDDASTAADMLILW